MPNFQSPRNTGAAHEFHQAKHKRRVGFVLFEHPALSTKLLFITFKESPKSSVFE